MLTASGGKITWYNVEMVMREVTYLVLQARLSKDSLTLCDFVCN